MRPPALLIAAALAASLPPAGAARADLSPPDYRAYHASRAYADGLIALRAGRTDSALAEAARAVELAPDDAEARYLLGVCLLFDERYEESRDALAKVVELRPELAAAHHDLGLVQLKLGDPDGARASFARVDELQPDSWIGPYRLAQTAALLQHDWPTCETELAEALRRGYPWLASLPVDPEWGEVAGDPAFLAMLERLLGREAAGD